MRCVTPCLLPQSPHSLQGVTLALCGAAEGWKAGPLHSAVLSTGAMTSDMRNREPLRSRWNTRENPFTSEDPYK